MDYYKKIKSKILDNEIYERIKDYSKERHKVLTYFEIGKLLHEAGKHYGESIISKYALSLEKEFGKKYNKRTLFRMRQFYLLFNVRKYSSVPAKSQKVSSLNKYSSNSLYLKGNIDQKVSSLSPQDQNAIDPNTSFSTCPSYIIKLTWTHYIYLIAIRNDDERNYYINIAITNHLSVRELRDRIKSKEYYRLDENTRNKLIKLEETDITICKRNKKFVIEYCSDERIISREYKLI